MTMKYRKLGRSGVQVSELCLGTMNFGPRTSEADSLQILSRAGLLESAEILTLHPA